MAWYPRAFCMISALLLFPACFESTSGSDETGGSATETSTSDSATDSETSSTTDSCPEGSGGCACYGNGTCDGDLVCTNGTCLPPGCTPGTADCPCVDGQCLGDLVCMDGLCGQADGTSTTTTDGSTSGATTGSGTGSSTTATSMTSTTTDGTGGVNPGPYGKCGDGFECMVADSLCLTTQGGDPIGFCAPPCGTDADCPDPGTGAVAVCQDATGNGDFGCLINCTANADCPADLTCDLAFMLCT